MTVSLLSVPLQEMSYLFLISGFTAAFTSFHKGRRKAHTVFFLLPRIGYKAEITFGSQEILVFARSCYVTLFLLSGFLFGKDLIVFSFLLSGLPRSYDSCYLRPLEDRHVL